MVPETRSSRSSENVRRSDDVPLDWCNFGGDQAYLSGDMRERGRWRPSAHLPAIRYGCPVDSILLTAADSAGTHIIRVRESDQICTY